MKHYVLVLALLCVSAMSYADAPVKKVQKIAGDIVENGTETGVPYASVLIVETLQGAVTNDKGEFEITKIEPGQYTLRVQAIGYKTVEHHVSVSAERPTEVHLQMQEESLMMDEVVVSANRNEVNRRNAPVVVNVMNRKLFEMVNSTDLAKSLNYQSGLRVENNCQNCGFPQVRINGLEGPYSQILINSRPVISALSGVYGLEQIPTNMVERIEVVRGGGSALFGANAVAGTINIITKDPINNSFQVASTLSSMNNKSSEQYMGANASLVGSDNTYGLALYQTYRNRNPYDADGDGFSEVGKLNMNTFGLRAYYRPQKHNRINLEYHTTNEFRRGGNAFDKEPFQSDITEQTRHIINSGGLSYDHFWNGYDQKLSVYGSIQHVDRNSYYGGGQDENAYGKTDDLTWVGGAMFVGNMSHLWFAPATFTGGLEYQSNKLHDVMVGYKRNLQQEVRIGGAFLQNEWKLPEWTFLAGVRLDKHNLVKHAILSPRINVLYKPSEHIQGRLTYSTGFRAPQAYDEDLHVTVVQGTGVQIRLADNLKEERSNSFSGSLDWSTEIGHWAANVLVEGFYTDLNNVFTLVNIGKVDGDEIKERRNGDGARVYGVNLDAKLAHGTMAQFQLGFTAQRSEYKKETDWVGEEYTAQYTKRMPRTPQYYGYFTFTSAPTKKFDFSVSGIYTGSMIVPHMPGVIEEPKMETTPDFVELNCKVNYTFNLHNRIKLQLNAGVQNILNSFQRDLDKGADRDSSYFYGPTQPRTYFIGIKLFG